MVLWRIPYLDFPIINLVWSTRYEVSSVETPNSHTHSYHLIVSKQAPPPPISSQFKPWTSSKTWLVIKNHYSHAILVNLVFKTIKAPISLRLVSSLTSNCVLLPFFKQFIWYFWIQTKNFSHSIQSRAQFFWSRDAIFLHLGICIET